MGPWPLGSLIVTHTPSLPHQNVTYIRDGKYGYTTVSTTHVMDTFFYLFGFRNKQAGTKTRRIWPIDWGVCLQEVWCQRSMAWAKLNGSSMIKDVIITIVKEN